MSAAKKNGEVTIINAFQGKEAFLMISGILDMALCPNNRVRHLALYARKKRTRKKNINRIFRILEKENDYAENQ